MKRILFILGLVLILVFSGCVKCDVKEISSIGGYYEIDSDKNICLDISGIDNEIIVMPNTNLISIEISGVNNVLRLPLDTKVEIENSGVDNVVSHYYIT